MERMTLLFYLMHHPESTSAIPNGVPVGLSDEFANDPLKEKQWNAFLRKNSIAPKPLPEVVTDLRDFLMPALVSAAQR
jgi:hypothetical protein